MWPIGLLYGFHDLTTFCIENGMIKDKAKFPPIICIVIKRCPNQSSPKTHHMQGVTQRSAGGSWVRGRILDYVVSSFCLQAHIKFWLWEV